MSLKASASASTSTKRAPALEPSNYMARLVQVVDLGVQPQRPFKGEPKPDVHQIQVTYELVTEFLQDEDGNDIEDKPRWIHETFPLYSLTSERAKSTARYIVLDPEREFDGDWREVVGKPCMVAVTEYISKHDGEKRNGEGAISGEPKGISIPPLVNEPKFFDMDEPDMEMFEAFPDWLKEKLTKECKSYAGSGLQRALEGGSAPAPAEDEAPFDEDIPV